MRYELLFVACLTSCLCMLGCEADAAETQGDGTIPLRIATLENDVAEIKSGLETLLAKFDAQQVSTKSILKAPRRHQAAPPKKTSHHKPKPKCCPQPAPMTTCAPKVYYHVVRPMPMTTCAPRTTCAPMPMTTCSPRRVSWCR